MAERQRYLGDRQRGTRERYLGDRARTTRERFTGGRQETDTGSFLSNLASDVQDTVVGFVPGVVETVRNPIKTGKAIGESYAHTYGPLVRGDVGEFAQRVHEHPLGPLLDLATIVTLGGGAATKLGLASTPLKQIELRSARALVRDGKIGTTEAVRAAQKLTVKGVKDQPDTIAGKALSRNPVIRKRQELVDRLMKSLPADTPLLGEFARYGRELSKLKRKDAMRLERKLLPYQRSYRSLKGPERSAYDLLVRYPLPRLLDKQIEAWRAGDEVGQAFAEAVSNPKVRAFYDQPTERMLKVRAEAEGAGALMAEVLGLDPEVVSQRPFLQMRMASGGDFKGGDVLEGGDSVEALRAELDAAGRPHPIYDPDTAAITPSPFSASRAAGGGKARPQRIGETRQSHGVLAQLGQLALGLDTLTPAFMRTMRYSLYKDLYEGLLASAVRVPKDGARLADGYEWVRQPRGKSGSETIPYTTKTRGQHLDDLVDDLPDVEDVAAYKDAFTTKSNDGTLAEENGHYLMVPSKTARQTVGEFTRSGRVLYWLIEKPTKIWRALVLNLRPAWLVNNIVGNHLLVAMRYFGPRLLDSYARSVREIGKADSAFVKLVEEHFPEQAGGTFIDTQLPAAGKTGRVAKVVGGGLAPADRATEAALRRTAIRSELKRSPEVKARLREMRGEKDRFEKAAQLALDENPGLAREISDGVNKALGDFLSLSSFERTYVRSLFPFYAWYKAITKIVIDLPLESPMRADLLVKLGEVGAEGQDPEYPSSLRGLIGIGEPGADGRERVFDTSRPNPYTTVTQLGENVAGSVNPFGAGIARALLGPSKYDQVTVGQAARGAVSGFKDAGYAGLPQVRLLEALGVNMPGYTLSKGSPDKPTLYDRGAREELLRFLGVAGGRISPERARGLKK